MLVFDQVGYYYRRGQEVVKDVSFTIEKEEFISIVGGNGSGKSTLAKLMNGLLPVKKGSVRLGEQTASDPEQARNIRKAVGLVFQNPEDQFITTNVTDEIVFGLENSRVPAEEIGARVRSALQAVGLERYADAAPHELSGGQKQRAAVAAVIAMRPQFIVFDEATSMLDPEGRNELMQLMQDLRKQGITIVQITHHMDEVLASHRVLLLDRGELVFDGPPDRFFREIPLEPYGLEQPFAVRIGQKLGWNREATADWKGRAASQWSTE